MSGDGRPLWLARLAETEFVKLVDPIYARAARFGTLYRHPLFPDRYDANQLLRVRCSPDETAELLGEVEQLYAGSGLSYRKLSGFQDVWRDHLAEALESEGWEVSRTAMKVHRREPKRPPNPELAIRSVTPCSPDLEELFTREGRLDRGFELDRQQYERVGGEYLVGYAEGKPACCTGWFVAHGIARFRYVYTAPWARDRGYAATIIQHVQSHPIVRQQDALIVFVGEGGPDPLYEALGFRTEGRYYSALRIN